MSGDTKPSFIADVLEIELDDFHGELRFGWPE
jgi:hypothetical protein